jgi:hypothetical protein
MIPPSKFVANSYFLGFLPKNENTVLLINTMVSLSQRAIILNGGCTIYMAFNLSGIDKPLKKGELFRALGYN